MADTAGPVDPPSVPTRTRVAFGVGASAETMLLYSLGHRQEGTLYAARTFFAKLDNSIGHGIASLSLWLIAFPDNARPGEVDGTTIWWLGMIVSPTTIIL